MSYSNATEKLKLPQWSNTDMANWTPDLNEAFEKIDEYARTTDNTAELARQDITDIQTDIEGLKNKDKSIEADITALQEKDVEQDADAQQTKTTLAKAVSDISGLQTDSNEHDTAITALQAKDKDLDAHASLNTQNINDIKASNNYKFFDKMISLQNTNILYNYNSKILVPKEGEGGHVGFGRNTSNTYFVIISVSVLDKKNSVFQYPTLFLPGLSPENYYDLDKMNIGNRENVGDDDKQYETGLWLKFSEERGKCYFTLNPDKYESVSQVTYVKAALTFIYLDNEG